MRVQSEQMWFCLNTWWVCFFKLFTGVLDGNLCSVRQMLPMVMLIVQPVFSLAIALHSWKTFSSDLRQQDTPFYGRWMSAGLSMLTMRCLLLSDHRVRTWRSVSFCLRKATREVPALLQWVVKPVLKSTGPMFFPACFLWYTRPRKA